MFNFPQPRKLGYGIAVGIGAAFLLPAATRLAADVARPLLKETIRGGLYLYGAGKTFYTEARQSFEAAGAAPESEPKRTGEKKGGNTAKTGANDQGKQDASGPEIQSTVSPGAKPETE